MKPYHHIPIRDNREPLVTIPHAFPRVNPHPYASIGAPYGDRSPYFVRESVLAGLVQAQDELQRHQPGWKILIFDAYRPIAVQHFMVDYTLRQVAQEQGLQVEALTDAQRTALLERVYEFWAVPSSNPATPPPHSTGAAVDITFVDANLHEVDMGSPIDELSERSHPNYTTAQLQRADLSPAERSYLETIHQHRLLLRQIMESAGFCQNPNEWWHFSLGDQMWAWLQGGDGSASPEENRCAHYGAV